LVSHLQRTFRDADIPFCIVHSFSQVAIYML
jgi:hypothetical protein